MSKIEAIKAAISTHDLVDGLKGPDGQDRDLGLCPFHEDHKPSLRLFPDGGYLCFTCGAKDNCSSSSGAI